MAYIENPPEKKRNRGPGSTDTVSGARALPGPGFSLGPSSSSGLGQGLESYSANDPRQYDKPQQHILAKDLAKQLRGRVVATEQVVLP